MATLILAGVLFVAIDPGAEINTALVRKDRVCLDGIHCTQYVQYLTDGGFVTEGVCRR